MLLLLHLLFLSFAWGIPEEETYTIWGLPHGPDGERFEGTVKLFYDRPERVRDQILESAKMQSGGDEVVEKYISDTLMMSETAQRQIRREDLFTEWKQTLIGRQIPYLSYKMSLPPIGATVPTGASLWCLGLFSSPLVCSLLLYCRLDDLDISS
jgi:hypothetical protein